MNLLPDVIKGLCLMYNDIALWAPVAIVEVSHYAAFTNCKERKSHKSHMSIILSVQAKVAITPRSLIKFLRQNKASHSTFKLK